MASAGRFTAAIGGRSLRIRPTSATKTFCSIHKSVPAFSSSSSQFAGAAFRFAPVLGSLATMLPLHSTIAAARLKSNIAIDTRCWSWLSQAWNSSVNNDPDNIASIDLGLVGLTFLLQLLILYALFPIPGIRLGRTLKRRTLATFTLTRDGYIAFTFSHASSIELKRGLQFQSEVGSNMVTQTLLSANIIDQSCIQML